jgi:CheY-like chemotaxis protein
LQTNSLTILLAESEPENRTRIVEVLLGSESGFDLRHVGDGEALLDYLQRRRRYEAPKKSPRPDLILLGCGLSDEHKGTALLGIKADPLSRLIPVINLDTNVKVASLAEEVDALSVESGRAKLSATPLPCTA